MLLGILVTAIYLLCTLLSPLTGSTEAAGAAVTEGARAAIPFVLEIAGALCLWSGVLELLERSGVSAGLARLLRRPLRRLFPRSAQEEVQQAEVSVDPATGAVKFMGLFLYFGLPLITWALGYIALKGYHLTKEEMVNVQAAISEKRTEENA